MVTPEDVIQANANATDMHNRAPRAMSAKYDRLSRRVVVQLSSHLGIFFSPRDAEGLEHATSAQLAEIEVSPSGFGLHFPKIDADIYLPALLEGVFGSEAWMARQMGSKGGRSRSIAKKKAARENGKRGGRVPQKKRAAAAR